LLSLSFDGERKLNAGLGLAVTATCSVVDSDDSLKGFFMSLLLETNPTKR